MNSKAAKIAEQEDRQIVEAVRHKLREQRAAAGMTQAELAKQSGLSLRCIAGVESGVRSPNIVTVVRMASAMLHKSQPVIVAEMVDPPKPKRKAKVQSVAKSAR